MKSMKNRRRGLPALAVAALLLLWLFFYLRPANPQEGFCVEHGQIDLRQVDLSNVLVSLPLEWEFYPGLHTPAEIAAGAAGAARRFEPGDETGLMCGSYRATLLLAGPGLYALDSWSLDYATRIYANGREVLSVGYVSESEADFVPRIQRYLLPLDVTGEARTDETSGLALELVIQYAHFCHPEGGSLWKMVFSGYENLHRYAFDTMLPVDMLSSCLFLLSAFYLIHFALQGSREALAFSLCCFLLALRDQSFFLSLMPENYDWQLVYRAITLCRNLVFPSFLLLTHLMYPGRFKRAVLYAYLALVLAGCIVLMTGSIPTLLRMNKPIIYLTAAGLAYYLTGLLRMLRSLDAANRLPILGLFVFSVSYAVELRLVAFIPSVTRNGVAPLGMMIAVMTYMLSLSLRQRERDLLLELERRRSESLAQVDQMKTEFLESVTHELKTPLTVISAYAQDSMMVLRDAKPALAEIKYNQRRIVHETDRLNRMVSQLLDVAAIEAGRMSLHCAPESLAALIRHVCAGSFHQIDAHNNSLVLNVPDDFPEIDCDRERIEQVLLNLLSNAVRHTIEGTVTISLTRGDGRQEVRVSDTGEGMDEESRAQVFRRYVERRVEILGRSGMGLYICKKIIDAHGGEIQLESAVNRGTSIRFYLPEKGEAGVWKSTSP